MEFSFTAKWIGLAFSSDWKHTLYPGNTMMLTEICFVLPRQLWTFTFGLLNIIETKRERTKKKKKKADVILNQWRLWFSNENSLACCGLTIRSLFTVTLRWLTTQWHTHTHAHTHTTPLMLSPRTRPVSRRRGLPGIDAADGWRGAGSGSSQRSDTPGDPLPTKTALQIPHIRGIMSLCPIQTGAGARQ